jgi:hypothetical protein
MFKVASWNLNSVRSRLTHVTAWLKVRELDVLLLQELKGTEFPSEAFKSLGYESVAVTQKAYNGVAILSRPSSCRPRQRWCCSCVEAKSWMAGYDIPLFCESPEPLSPVSPDSSIQLYFRLPRRRWASPR